MFRMKNHILWHAKKTFRASLMFIKCIDSEGMLISGIHEEAGRDGLSLLIVDDRISARAKMY